MFSLFLFNVIIDAIQSVICYLFSFCLICLLFLYPTFLTYLGINIFSILFQYFYCLFFFQGQFTSISWWCWLNILQTRQKVKSLFCRWNRFLPTAKSGTWKATWATSSSWGPSSGQTAGEWTWSFWPGWGSPRNYFFSWFFLMCFHSFPSLMCW